MRIMALNDISFKSEEGAVRLDTSSVLMPSLPIAIPTSKPGANRHDIYQLCVCNNGKLFLAPSYSSCHSQEDDRICR